MQITNRINHFIKKHFLDRYYLHQLNKKHPQATEIIKYVRNNNLTYLDYSALFDLYQAIEEIEANNTSGTLIEAGCALGGSAIVMTAAKSRPRSLAIYDTFGTIPPPSEKMRSIVKIVMMRSLKERRKGLVVTPIMAICLIC